MPRPRFGNLAENKRKSILEAASLEFFERGYGGASVNRIIAAAGISKGAMYYYFDDKEDLFFTVIQDIQDRVFEAVGTLPAVKTPVEFWQAADGFFRKTIAFAAEHHLVAGLIRCFNTALAKGELTKSPREFQRSHFDFHRRFVRLGQSVGAVRSDLPDDLLFPLLEGVDQAGDLWFARHFEEFTPEKMTGVPEIFLNLYRRLLEPGSDDLETRQ